MHDAGRGRMARRKLGASAKESALVEYASKEPSAFAEMLGGLIEANVRASAEKRKDFDALVVVPETLGSCATARSRIR